MDTLFSENFNVSFSLQPGGAHTFLLDQESMQRTGTKCSSAKLNQDGIPLCDQTSKNLNICKGYFDFNLALRAPTHRVVRLEPTTFKHKIILNDSSSVYLRSRNARSSFSASADCTAEIMNKKESNCLSMTRNVAFTYIGIPLKMFRQKTIEPNCEAIIQSIKKQIIMDNDVSDDFLFLFSKNHEVLIHTKKQTQMNKRRSQSGGEDGKHSVLGK